MGRALQVSERRKWCGVVWCDVVLFFQKVKVCPPSLPLTVLCLSVCLFFLSPFFLLPGCVRTVMDERLICFVWG